MAQQTLKSSTPAVLYGRGNELSVEVSYVVPSTVVILREKNMTMCSTTHTRTAA